MDVLRRVNIPCAWRSAFEISIVEMQMQEQFINLFFRGVRNIEFSVAHVAWVSHQKRGVTTDRLVEQIKDFILDAVIVGFVLGVFKTIKIGVTLDVLRLGDLDFVGSQLVGLTKS